MKPVRISRRPLATKRTAAVRLGRRVVLSPTQVRSTQNLGGGFRRHVFAPFVIRPNSFVVITFTAGSGRVVINAGWSISSFLAAWPTNSFPLSSTRWRLIIQNPTSVARTITPYLITKTR